MSSERDVRNAALDTYYAIRGMIEILPHRMVPVLSYDWAMQAWECRIQEMPSGKVLAQVVGMSGNGDPGAAMAYAISGAMESLLSGAGAP